MTENGDSGRIGERLVVISRITTVLAIGLGGLTLLGWALGAPVLVHLFPVVVVMNPLSALLFILAGSDLWLRREGLSRPHLRKVLNLALPGVVVVLAAVKLTDYLFGLPVHVDELLFAGKSPLFSQYRGGEMAPNTALCFLLFGLALFLFDARYRKTFCPGQALVLVTSLIALLALIGYLYRVLVLNRLGTFKPMSLESALCFTMLGVGYFAAQPKRGLMLTITNTSIGGSMARRLLPMAVLVPLLLGLLLLLGEKNGLYREEVALSIFAASNIVIFTGLIWWNAKLLYHADLERCRTERHLAAQHNATRVLAEASSFAQVVPRLLEVVCEALGWQVGALWTFDPKAAALRCAGAWTSGEPRRQVFVEASRASVFASGVDLPGQVWARAEAVWIEDIAVSEDSPRAALAAEAGLHGAFGFPIWSDHEKFGVMEFLSSSAEEPDPALLEMMGIVGTQVGLFLERTRAEERLRGTTANLQRSNTDLQQFAHVASHDLFEPLRMITSYLQLLQQKYASNLDAHAQEFIGFALDGAKRMDALIRDLLAYSRVDVRGRSLEPTQVEQVLSAAIANLKVAIDETAATIIRGPLPTVRADHIQLTQVFQNLIGNAIKFHGTEPPRIEINAERRNAEWLFSVRDNGIGIDPKFSDTIFVIFQRLHTRQEYAGTGMGLAICKKIIERHGGHIWVESRPGQGSTFFFTLPALEEDVKRDA